MCWNLTRVSPVWGMGVSPVRVGRVDPGGDGGG